MYLDTDALEKLGVNPGIVPITAGIGLLVVGPLLRRRMEGWAFILTALSIVNATATIFMILFPRVMVSSLNPDYSLTVYNASSSPYTLRVMTVIALTLVPIVLLYQGWTYWVFRKRITAETILEY